MSLTTSLLRLILIAGLAFPAIAQNRVNLGPTNGQVTGVLPGANGGLAVANTGKSLTLGTGALTFANTTGTTMTFPSVSGTVCVSLNACSGTTITATTGFFAGTGTPNYVARTYVAGGVSQTGGFLFNNGNSGFGMSYDGGNNVNVSAYDTLSLLAYNGSTYAAALNVIGNGASQRVSITAGTATTDVAALSVTRTNNNAAVATGVKFAFTDTTSAAGFLPFQVTGGASATTNLLSTSKDGTNTGVNFIANANTSGRFGFGGTSTGMYHSAGSDHLYFTNGSSAVFKLDSNGAITGANKLYRWSDNNDPNSGSIDLTLSRNAAGVAQIGTTTANASGSLLLTGITASGTAVVLSGLGAATGTPNSLCLNGTTVTVNAALTCTVSSRDQKDNIEPFSGDGLKMVAMMEPDKFVYRDNYNRNRLGFMADDLAKIDPRLAEWNADGKPSSIDFPAMMAVLTKALQEQQKEISDLKKKVADMEQPRYVNATQFNCDADCFNRMRHSFSTSKAANETHFKQAVNQ